MYEDIEFDSWMKQVNKEIEARIGLGVNDLADCPFRDWFDDGVSAVRAAQMTINNDLNGDYDS